MCYALIENGKVAGLYPVMISRALHDLPARSLLPESLRPATTLAQLSPADRVFGWTNADGAGGYRGQLRIGPVTRDAPRFTTTPPTSVNTACRWQNDRPGKIIEGRGRSLPGPDGEPQPVYPGKRA